ncbi:hypothetical protein FE633_46000, partial [Streptomyces montanus]
GDGVSTYLALIFGTLLSSQGTDASFVLTLSGFPPGASLRCFQPYQTRFPSRFGSEFVSGGQLEGPCLFGCLAASFRRARLYQKFLTGLTDRSFLSNRGLLRKRIPGSGRCQPLLPSLPGSAQLCKSTSPHVPCQRVPWGEEETSSSAGVLAHQAAVGTEALRSDSSTSPVAPARVARPPRT